MTGLTLSGLGAVTSVGWTATAAAAAIRADISRPTEILEFEVYDPDTADLMPVIAHPVAGLTDGFVLFGRWLRLARVAVEDLLRTTGDPPGLWDGADLVLATAEPDEAIFLSAAAATLPAIREAVGLALIEDLRLPIRQNQVEVIAAGRIAPALAIEHAQRRIAAGSPRVLVVVVDSLLDPLLLESLAGEHRLKDSDHATGFSPGEAAVALLVEPRASVTRRSGTVLAELGAVRARATPSADPRKEHRAGKGMSDTLLEALDAAGVGLFTGDLYIDLNGQEWRAQQWGTALVRLQGRFDGNVQIPSLSVGDVGAVSGALGVMLAIRSFARRNASSRIAAVLSSGEDATVAAMVIAAPPKGNNP